ncbi:methyltransferase domain-containing protein [Bacillaceae bacterium S4-13-56]
MVSYTDTLAKFGIGGAHPGGLQLTKQLLGGINPKKDSFILDVGCGTGQTIEFIESNYDCSITGVEPHKEMLEKVENRVKKLGLKSEVVMGKAEQLPFKNHQFHFVLSESVTAFTVIDMSLKEYYRVIQPSGKLVMVEMTLTKKLSSLAQKEIQDFYGIPTLCSENDWQNALVNKGFLNIKSYEAPTESSVDDVEFNTSYDLQAYHFDTMNQHQILLEKYKDHLKPYVYIAEK